MTVIKSYQDWEPTFHLNPKKSALIVIDMQNAFVKKGSQLEVASAREQIPAISNVIAFCRSSKIPVIYTVFCVAPDFNYKFYWKIARQRGLKLESPDCMLWEGKEETMIVPELKPLPNERIIKKSGYDAFAGTELDHVLKASGINTVIITGTVLNWCVDSTVRGAFHHHYNVVVIADCVSAYDHAGGTASDWTKMELNFFAEAFGRVLSASEVINELTNAPI